MEAVEKGVVAREEAAPEVTAGAHLTEPDELGGRLVRGRLDGDAADDDLVDLLHATLDEAVEALRLAVRPGQLQVLAVGHDLPRRGGPGGVWGCVAGVLVACQVCRPQFELRRGAR
jgi:hypothetical protein